MGNNDPNTSFFSRSVSRRENDVEENDSETNRLVGFQPDTRIQHRRRDSMSMASMINCDNYSTSIPMRDMGKGTKRSRRASTSSYLRYKETLFQREMNPPKDKKFLIFFIIMLHGVGIMYPWNMFLTAKYYFVDYKFNSSLSEPEKNVTVVQQLEILTDDLSSSLSVGPPLFSIDKKRSSSTEQEISSMKEGSGRGIDYEDDTISDESSSTETNDKSTTLIGVESFTTSDKSTTLTGVESFTTSDKSTTLTGVESFTKSTMSVKSTTLTGVESFTKSTTSDKSTTLTGVESFIESTTSDKSTTLTDIESTDEESTVESTNEESTVESTNEESTVESTNEESTVESTNEESTVESTNEFAITGNNITIRNKRAVNKNNNITAKKKTTTQPNGFANNFVTYQGIVANLPLLIFTWLNVFVPKKNVHILKRIVTCIVINTICCALTLALVFIDTSQYMDLFYWLTMGTIVVMSGAMGVYQNSMYALVARLPIRYTVALVIGSNLSGTIVSIINIVSMAVSTDTKTGAVFYFSSALCYVFVTLITCYFLQRNEYYLNFKIVNWLKEMISHEHFKKRRNASVSSDEKDYETIKYFDLHGRHFKLFGSMFFIFFVTMAVFPTILVDVTPVDKNFFIPAFYYTSIVGYLAFNASATLGSLAAMMIPWTTKTLYLHLIVYARIILIPLFLLCNYNPVGSARVLPVLINNDYAFMFMVILLGLTSGYLSTAILQICASVERGVKNTEIVNMFAAGYLVTGVCAGLVTSLCFPYLVRIVIRML